jgi:hypothetical protein
VSTTGLERLLRAGEVVPAGTYVVDRDLDWLAPTVCPFQPGDYAVLASDAKRRELVRITKITWDGNHRHDGSQMGWQVVAHIVTGGGTVHCSPSSLEHVRSTQSESADAATHNEGSERR